MGQMDAAGSSLHRRRFLSLLVWALLVAALVGAAYFLGAGLSQRWLGGASLAAAPTLAAPATASPTQSVAAAPIQAGQAVESSLDTLDAQDVWEFSAQAGQNLTIEVWFHPGSGSTLGGGMLTELLGPDGSVVAEGGGDLILPPYITPPALAASGIYRLRVAPSGDAPGRYSLLLTLSEAAAPALAGAGEGSDPPAPVPTEPLLLAEQLHFLWPAPRRTISGWTFHDPRNPSHIGLDISARMHDPIVTTADGVVTFAEWGGGYGNLVIVEHNGGWRSYYAHLTEFAVEQGQVVRQGELLGGAGTTGNSTGPHLHFELRYTGRPVDPLLYLQ